MAFDIDIDVPSTIDIGKLFPTAIPASRVQADYLVKHPCGFYFENIPIDSVTKLAAIPFEQAEELDYMKVDFLHLSILNQFSSKAELLKYTKTEPDWSLLEQQEIVQTLFQIKNSWDIVQLIKPRSLTELADLVAIIRPTKRKLIQQYLVNKNRVRPLLYKQDQDDKTSFRRSHAIAYAYLIYIQLNVITAKLAPSDGAVEL